jgi:DNA transformation protein
MTAELPIESLCNLGPKSGQWLREVGITTIAKRESLGPVVAYRLVKQHNPRASLNLLWALAAE